MAGLKSFDTWSPVIVMLAVDFAFAVVNILLKEVLNAEMNHLVLITYRQSISTIFLVPIGYFWERNSRPKLTLRILCYLFFSALVGASLTQYFFLLGIQYTSATFACAFINMVPAITFIMSLPFGLEIVNIKTNRGRAKLIGTLVCICGAMILTLYKGMPLVKYSRPEAPSPTMDQAISLSSGKKTERWTVGSIALMGGTLLWSSWFLIQSNIGKLYPCQYSSTAIMSFFGAIQSAVISLSIDRKPFLGVVGSGLCYVAMSWCVKKRGPVFTAAFSPLVQIMAVMFDIPILHEQLHLGSAVMSSVLGSATVIAGLYILLWGKKKDAENSSMELVQEAEEVKDQEAQLQVTTITSGSRCP
ncbi:WAT1-related protein [Vitis vinifera]|uniref:WAT1-related protein n=1 Tax=Vitis vinifera TaxID=29760 RepID=A0A438JJJ4_VITVI|nr:WAT1-related protein [Vitis vinifera]